MATETTSDMSAELHLESVRDGLPGILKTQIYQAMESYAKEVADKQSVEFLEWLGNEYPRLTAHDISQFPKTAITKFHSTRKAK